MFALPRRPRLSMATPGAPDLVSQLDKLTGKLAAWTPSYFFFKESIPSFIYSRRQPHLLSRTKRRLILYLAKVKTSLTEAPALLISLYSKRYFSPIRHAHGVTVNKVIADTTECSVRARTDLRPART